MEHSFKQTGDLLFGALGCQFGGVIPVIEMLSKYDHMNTFLTSLFTEVFPSEIYFNFHSFTVKQSTL